MQREATKERHRRELFDGQAARFEQRAGLPQAHCQDIAQEVLRLGGVCPGELIVEVGPGTGQLGRWFGAPARYVGLDLSAAMLREFQKQPGGQLNRRVLVRADANAGWPVAEGAARAIFSSRAIHLLDQEHVASEVFRVAAKDGAVFIIGRTQREPSSVRARMAREMNERLRRHGLEGRGGEQQQRKLLDACRQRGAEILESLTVARWQVTASARQSLDSWRSLKSLGGLSVPERMREQILTELEAWAETEFGGLDQLSASWETYVLKPLRVPARAAR